MKATIAAVLVLACISCTAALYDDWVRPSTPANRPPIAEQRATAITMIADSVLSPDFVAVAVVQSRKDTIMRIDALRRKHYGIEDTADIVMLSEIICALNIAPVYQVEAVYSASELPPILAIIQDEMHEMKPVWDYEEPYFRPAMFPFDNTVWLAFLKNDSVFNYEMKPRSGSYDERDFINNVLSNQTTVAGFKQGLMLEGVLSETNQFSLVKAYANYPIQKSGLPFVPFILEGNQYASDAEIPKFSTFGQDLDLTKELLLPAEFLADLRLIIKFAATYEPDMEPPAPQTPIGTEVRNRVLEKLKAGASNAHLHAGWIRPPPAP